MRVFQSLLREHQRLDETVKIDQRMINDVIRDPGFRVGFEYEFHIMNADRLLSDEAGELPGDFYSFRDTELLVDTNPPQAAFYEIRPYLAQYLGIPETAISINEDEPGKWRLKTDDSLYGETGTDLYMMYHPRENLGAELVSPPLPLREGLQALYRVTEMISDFHSDSGVVIQTSPLTGIHINLSHSLMTHQALDYAKVAILLGDEHYLRDFRRQANHYAKPLLRGMASKIAHALDLDANTGELDMMTLHDWSAKKVFDDLSEFVPLGHHESVDFSRLDSDNPYVEFRMAGNTGYEERVDDLVRMVLRFAALLKIGLDPNAYRREYLTKTYRLITSISGDDRQPRKENDVNAIMNKVRIYLRPILFEKVRQVLKKIHMSALSGTATDQDAIWLLYVIRVAYDSGYLNNNNVRRGLSLLMHDIFHAKLRTLQLILRNPQALMRVGVLKQSDFPKIQMQLRPQQQIDPSTGKQKLDPRSDRPIIKPVRVKHATPDKSGEIMKMLRSTIATL